MPSHSIKEVITECFEARLIEKGIVENIIREGATLDEKTVWAIKEANLSLTGGEKYKVIVKAHFLSEVTREAREVVASAEYRMNTIALALMAESTGHRIVGNFFMTINKPVVPTALFTNETKAMDWLRQQE